MATLLSRIFRRSASRQPALDGSLDLNPALSLLNETPEDVAQPALATDDETATAGSKELSGSWPMERVLNDYPSAQSALFARYHVGGCSSCGFQPSDTLEAVCVSHDLDVAEVVMFIGASHEVERQLEVSPEVVAEQLKSGEIKLLDVRSPEEFEITKIPGSTLVDGALAQEIIETWPKDTGVVTVCHHGIRSLDAAAYLKSHGFQNSKSMTGGIDAWSVQVDPSVVRY
jgi:rhodanese-related sulfurtransferase